MPAKTILAIFCAAIAGAACAATAPDTHWQSGFPINGTDGTVNALVVDATGAVYAGGQFAVAGDVAAANVAKWDGTNWSALGTGPGFGTVYALAVNGTNLYVAGDIGVAEWDGTNWTQLGGTTDAAVLALAVSGSTLYAGGSFTLFGAASVPHMAQWDGTSWSAVGGGTDSDVDALAVIGTDLYAGGNF